MPGEPTTITVVCGPFKISYASASGAKKFIKTEHIENFWAQESCKNFADKQGCYIFALKFGKRIRPWYIGSTGRSLKDECFNDANIKRYNEFLQKGKFGSPILFFVVRKDNRKISPPILKDMEKYLIHASLYVNPELLNVHHRGNLPKWGIENVIRIKKQGQNPASVDAFRKMLSLN